MLCDDKKSYVREDIHVDLQYLGLHRKEMLTQKVVQCDNRKS